MIGLHGVQNDQGVHRAVEIKEEALENIQEAIELYLQPDSIKLEPGAILQEITTP